MRFAKLFTWRRPGLATGKLRLRPSDIAGAAKALVEDLSVEGLPYDKTPRELEEHVRAFRKLRTVARVSAAKTWLIKSHGF